MHFIATSKVCTAYLFSSMQLPLKHNAREWEPTGHEREIAARLNAYRKKGDQINSVTMTLLQQGTKSCANKRRTYTLWHAACSANNSMHFLFLLSRLASHIIYECERCAPSDEAISYTHCTAIIRKRSHFTIWLPALPRLFNHSIFPIHIDRIAARHSQLRAKHFPSRFHRQLAKQHELHGLILCTRNNRRHLKWSKIPMQTPNERLN